LTTGEATSFNPNITISSGTTGVYAMEIYNDTLYFGGAFTAVGGTTRNRIASVDIATQSLTSWNPNAGGIVGKLLVSGNTLFVGGEFTSIGGQTRNRLAAIDKTTAAATSFNPNINNTVYTIYLDEAENIIYVGGKFSTVNASVTRNRVAAFDTITGNVNGEWMPEANSDVYVFLKNSNLLAVGGSFQTIKGISRNNIAYLPLLGSKCSPNGTLLSTETFSSYQWYKDGIVISGATGSSYLATAPGLYTVEVTRTGGCIGESEQFEVYSSSCSGSVGEVSSQNSSFPLRIVQDSNSSTGYYLYFEKVAGATGYNIYEGNIGSYYSHGNGAGNICNASVMDMGNGEMRIEFNIDLENHYYPVTQFVSGIEGPIGYNSNNEEIDPQQNSCSP